MGRPGWGHEWGRLGRRTSPTTCRGPNGITAYDEGHLVIYLRLLDAEADGASVEDMARIVLGIDSAKEPQRAAKAVASHLRRAKWMSEQGHQRFSGH
jgi:hypothetical protein